MSSSLTLFRGFTRSGAFAGSPFVAKLEARLRLEDVTYRTDTGSPKTAPRGKIPYIEVENNGTKDSIGDSTLITRSLIENGTLNDLNAHLSPTQKAHDFAIRALLEDKIYFYGMREKWVDNYYMQRSGALGALPWPVQVVVGLIAYRSVSSTLYGQGTARYTDEEMMLMKQEAWDNVNAPIVEAKRLSEGRNGPFWLLGGDRPTEADATVFGFVASSLVCDA